MKQTNMDFKPVFFGLLVKVKPLWWQEKGLSYTASGYGAKIPTQYMVFGGGRWRRVYCAIYSNVGTLYIIVNGERVICEIET